MGEERDLREDDAEGTGDEQLEPAVAQQDEPGDRAAEGEHEDSSDDAVEPGCRCASSAGSRACRRTWFGQDQRFQELSWKRYGTHSIGSPGGPLGAKGVCRSLGPEYAHPYAGHGMLDAGRLGDP